jgi:hypothetical protein
MALYSVERNHQSFLRIMEEAGLLLIDPVIQIVKFVKRTKGCAKEILILSLEIYAQSKGNKFALVSGTSIIMFVLKTLNIVQSLQYNI